METAATITDGLPTPMTARKGRVLAESPSKPTATSTAVFPTPATPPPPSRRGHGGDDAVDMTPLVAATMAPTPASLPPAAGGTGGIAATGVVPVWSPNDGLRTLASVVPSPFGGPPSFDASATAATRRFRPIAPMLAPATPALAALPAASGPGDGGSTAMLTASPATAAAALTLASSVHRAALSRTASTSTAGGASPEDDAMFPLGDGDDPDDTYSRKEKSLALLCRNFSELFRGRENTEITLDTAARQLAVERRRIYDIVNVFESLDIMERLGKNKYRWHGLARIGDTVQALLTAMHRRATGQPQLTDRVSQLAAAALPPGPGQPVVPASRGTGDGSRREKSLGILSLRFIVLFLTSENHSISLGDAASTLLRDGDDDGDGEADDVDDATEAGGASGGGGARSARLKTKVRRLYDIANILTALRVVAKVRQPGSHYSKPVFQWIGPGRSKPAPARQAAAPSALPASASPTRPSAAAAGPAALAAADGGARSSPDTAMAVAALTKAANSSTAAMRSLFVPEVAAPAVTDAAAAAPVAASDATPALKRRRVSTAAAKPASTTAPPRPAAAVPVPPAPLQAASTARASANSMRPNAATERRSIPPPPLSTDRPEAWSDFYVCVTTAMARAYEENIRASGVAVPGPRCEVAPHERCDATVPLTVPVLMPAALPHGGLRGLARRAAVDAMHTDPGQENLLP